MHKHWYNWNINTAITINLIYKIIIYSDIYNNIFKTINSLFTTLLQFIFVTLKEALILIIYSARENRTVHKMEKRTTIFNLLNVFSNIQKNVSWKIKCIYCNGTGVTINQINIVTLPENSNVGMFIYQVETGRVSFFKYKSLKKSNSEDIVDMLLDMINYSKKEVITS